MSTDFTTISRVFLTLDHFASSFFRLSCRFDDRMIKDLSIPLSGLNRAPSMSISVCRHGVGGEMASAVRIP